MGASYISDMLERRQIDEREASHLLSFCNNSGPAFIMGAVGAGVFHSAGVGLLLYAIHIFSALLAGVLLRPQETVVSAPCASYAPESIKTALPEAVRQSVVSTLNVCGFVVCFTVLTGLLDALGLLSALTGAIAARFGLELHFVRAALTGVLELGSAVGAMQGLAATPANLALAAAILGWGGISVHFQTAAVLADADIKTAPHFRGRLMSAAIGAALGYILGTVFY